MELIQESPQITENGNMTILEIMGNINFYDGIVRKINHLDFRRVYKLGFNAMGGYLTPQSPLEMPSKIYDFEQEFREQVLRTLRSEDGDMNIGVLLSGYKGQGKSIIAKQLAIESGLPIILITNAINKKDDFVSYLENIKQDHVIFVDEFEKLFKEKYDVDDQYHTQESFLSFLSGTTTLKNKRLVIFTSNKELDDKFHNRTGRIRYHKEYNFMSKEVFNAILDDKLIYPEHRQDLLENLDPSSCTVDILTTLIQEINIQNKPYSSFKSFFNFKERKISYTKWKKEDDGWKYVEDIKLKRALGMNSEDVNNLVPGCYSAEVLENDEEKVIYQLSEWVEDKDDDDKSHYVKNIYKLTKSGSLRSLAF